MAILRILAFEGVDIDHCMNIYHCTVEDLVGGSASNRDRSPVLEDPADKVLLSQQYGESMKGRKRENGTVRLLH